MRCNDTPGFIANRLGVYWIGTAIGEALARGLTVEEADAVMGAPLGIPRTGVFGLMDIVGLGLHEQVNASFDRLLPAGDAWHGVPAHADLLRRMVAMGATGRGAGRGFYARDGGTRLAIDLETLEYRPAARPPRLPRTPRELVEMGGPLGEYAAAVLGRTLAYAAAMVPEVTDRPELIDLAMQRGYGWERGPFAADRRARRRPRGRARTTRDPAATGSGSRATTRPRCGTRATASPAWSCTRRRAPSTPACSR